MTTINEQQAIIDAAERARQNFELYEFLYRDGYNIPIGLGEEDQPCSIAAINLVLDDEFSDLIRPEMSYLIGQWMIQVQDWMPDHVRNGCVWKDLIVDSAWTGRENEVAIEHYQQEWLFHKVFGSVQVIAGYVGCGSLWRLMCDQQSPRSINNVILELRRLKEAARWDPPGKNFLRKNLLNMAKVVRSWAVNMEDDDDAEINYDAFPEPTTLRMFSLHLTNGTLVEAMNNVFNAWDYYHGLTAMGSSVEARLRIQEWLTNEEFKIGESLTEMIAIAKGAK